MWNISQSFVKEQSNFYKIVEVAVYISAVSS